MQAIAGAFAKETDYAIEATFGAVGVIAAKLKEGAAADLIILTRPMLDQLVAEGRVVAGTVADLGRVHTGVAVRVSDPSPAVADAEALREALLAAQGIYFPDPLLATAGIHFARVIDVLGIRADVASRLRTFPNGATAMRELAAATGKHLIGVTQVTEINHTEGVRLVAPLPKAFELAMVYSIGVCKGAPAAAAQFAARIASSQLRALREKAGFN